MVGKYSGKLIGHNTYTKDGKISYVYHVFCEGKKDPATGLYTTDCNIAKVIEQSPVIANPKADMLVGFSGELKQFGKLQLMTYSDIEVIGK